MLDYMMQTTSIEAPYGIRWNLNDRLNDIDYGDDICLMAHRFVDIQEILKNLVINTVSIGIKVNIKKATMMSIGTNVTTPLTVNGTAIENLETFSYLGSIISANDGSEEDILARIDKARVAFQALH
ncbi:uncharacterized protein [Musca autumnalis]|uniref:uncharacterized protein n=1 Tax=Musca autumnalis TaxID=221902 RepID=UPI003CF2399E